MNLNTTKVASILATALRIEANRLEVEERLGHHRGFEVSQFKVNTSVSPWACQWEQFDNEGDNENGVINGSMFEFVSAAVEALHGELLERVIDQDYLTWIKQCEDTNNQR